MNEERKPLSFADQVTADHAIIPDADVNKHGDTVAVIMQDRKTRWLQSYGCKTKSAEDTKFAFNKFFGPMIKPKQI